jgi:iron(III) transport system substrate-binding protein
MSARDFRRGRGYAVGTLLAAAAVMAGTGIAAAQSPSAEPLSSPASSPAGDALASVCAAGAEEGTFIEWGGEEPETTQLLFDRFAAIWPGITPEFLSIRPSDAAQRIATEHAAGQLNVDLFSSEPATLVDLVERGIVDAEIDWESLGVPPDLVTTQNALRFSRSGAGLVYNTGLVDPADLPSTWEELIDPKWEGQVVVDPRGRPWDAISLEWGRDQTIDYVQRLKETVKPLIIEGTTTGMVAVGSGEALITTNGKSKETLEQQAAGAPLEIKYLDVTPADDGIIAKVAEGPHPNASACYAAWLTGPDGQAALSEIALSSNLSELPGVPEGAVTIVIENDEQATAVDEVASELAAIWTAP